jgi:hypothetical protein
MRRQWVRWIIPLLVVPIVALLAACGGDGGGGSDNDPEAVKVVTGEEPVPVALEFDDRSFVEVASQSDRDAIAASINLALGSTQLFAVVRDGADELKDPADATVQSSAIILALVGAGVEIDDERFEVDWNPSSDAGGRFSGAGVWEVVLDLPGTGDINYWVQFRDEAGTPSEHFGSTTTDAIEIRTDKSEVTFFDVEILTVTDAWWTISEIRASGDVVAINGEGEVDVEFPVPYLDDHGFEFSIDNLRLDFTDPDSFRRPDSGRITLKVHDVVPVLGEDLLLTLDFEGGDDATVTADGICDLEFQWDLGDGLPEELEIRDCF